MSPAEAGITGPKPRAKPGRKPGCRPVRRLKADHLKKKKSFASHFRAAFQAAFTAFNLLSSLGSDTGPGSDTTPRQAGCMATFAQPQAGAGVSPTAQRCVNILYAILHGNSGFIRSRASLFLSTLLDVVRGGHRKPAFRPHKAGFAPQKPVQADFHRPRARKLLSKPPCLLTKWRESTPASQNSSALNSLKK